MMECKCLVGMAKVLIVNLYRFKSTDEGTFGFMTYNGAWWYSLELPWRDNKPNISCIPVGEYFVSLRYSPHFHRELYHLHNVKDRSYILIHPANLAGDVSKGWQSQLQGCITIGKRVGKIRNKFGKMQRAIISSGIAINEFYSIMQNRDFNLIIEEI